MPLLARFDASYRQIEKDKVLFNLVVRLAVQCELRSLVVAQARNSFSGYRHVVGSIWFSQSQSSSNILVFQARVQRPMCSSPLRSGS